MRKIHKTISLEPMTSRLPSVVPAYNPIDNSIMYFDDNALKARGYTYTSNYGLVPINIEIPNIPCLSATTWVYNKDRGECGEWEEIPLSMNCQVISFERLSIWYHKFKQYYDLLKCGHCGVHYNTAVEYYDNEVKKDPSDLVFGNDRQTYVDLDNEISNMGGRNTYNIICGLDNSDEDCFIPTYTIPNEYQNYWGKETLYYPEVINWIGWFSERKTKYGTNPNCEVLADYDDCSEYVNRGGSTIYDSMELWYNGIQNKIPTSSSSSCESSIIVPIHLENSIEDLGEFSIFCEEYKIGVDYRASKDDYSSTANTEVGTLVIKDGEIQQLISGAGYIFDEVYMENIEDKDAWASVTLGDITDSDYPFSCRVDNLSGYTSSKLRTLHLDNYLTDDIGNMIEGLYDVSGKANHQPEEGEILEPLYQVGVITNVTNIEGHDGMFKGDVIDSMLFYYKTVDDEIDDSTSAMVNTSGVSIVSTINASSSRKDETKIYEDDIYCEVEYNIGNIYELDESGNTTQIESGVVYTEEVQFEKANVEYYLKNKVIKSSPSDVAEPKVHSVSYPICVYRLKQKNVEIRDNTHNTPYEDNLTKFELSAARKYDADYDTPTDPNDHCDSKSGDTKAPLMREEYRLGVAAPESVKGDIYIDRGINSAFEKHLKLGEVTSLESMLQYGNGYFKIMEN
jgi:hypothetical protein